MLVSLLPLTCQPASTKSSPLSIVSARKMEVEMQIQMEIAPARNKGGFLPSARRVSGDPDPRVKNFNREWTPMNANQDKAKASAWKQSHSIPCIEYGGPPFHSRLLAFISG